MADTINAQRQAHLNSAYGGAAGTRAQMLGISMSISLLSSRRVLRLVIYQPPGVNILDAGRHSAADIYA